MAAKPPSLAATALPPEGAAAACPHGTYRYYEGTLSMLGLLHVSGTFELW